MDLHNIHLIGKRTFSENGFVHFECDLSTASYEYTFLRDMLENNYKIIGVIYNDVSVEFKTTMPWDTYLDVIKQSLVA